MINQELATLLRRVAHAYSFLEVAWKPRAYERAASSIERMSEDVRAIAERKDLKRLEAIPGVGEAIAKHIVEYVERGRVEEFEELFSKIPDELEELLEIRGLGPKTVRELYDELKIESIDELLYAISKGRLRELEGFSSKRIENIENALREPKSERVPLGEAMPQAEDLIGYLRSKAQRVDYAGSLRRMRATIGDIDLLTATKDAEAFMDEVAEHPDVERVLERGKTLCRIVLKNGLHVDVRIVAFESYGAALMYFTGSRQHNINLRTLAREKGYSLSEYGLETLDDETLIETPDEQKVYAKLGLEYIPPELREDRGEIEAAEHHELPQLVTIDDLHGDLHLHSTFSDGQSSIEEMARAAKERGYAYLAITDHSPSSGRGLKPERIDEQHAEIERVERDVGIRILKGAEVDILEDGSLDYDDTILERFDFVIASPHRYLDQDEETYTKRLIKAVEHPKVRIIGHPTGRLLGERDGAEPDMKRIAQAAARNRVALEINASPKRLDLDDEHVLAASDCLFSIDTDSHTANGLHEIRYGIGMARRGWLEKERVLNSKTLDELERWLRQ